MRAKTGQERGPMRPLVGRIMEVSRIMNRAAALISGQPKSGGIILVEGNSGLGKTKLLLEVRYQLDQMHLASRVQKTTAFNILFSVASAGAGSGQNKRLQPWCRIFKEMMMRYV
jgi:hypothetical protein